MDAEIAKAAQKILAKQVGFVLHLLKKTLLTPVIRASNS